MQGKTYSYTIFWQRKDTEGKNGLSHQEYFSEMKRYIDSRFKDLKIEIDKKRNDILQNQSQILRGGLAEFLSTPLQSDSNSINRTILETLSIAVNQSVTHPYPHLLSLGSVSLEPQNIFLQKKGAAAIRAMLARGKKEMQRRGIQFAKNYSPAYYTKFLLSDLDIIPAIKEILLNFTKTDLKETTLHFEPRCSNLALYLHHQKQELETKQFSVQLSLEEAVLDSALYDKILTIASSLNITHCSITRSQPLSIFDSQLSLAFDADLISTPLGTIFTSLEANGILTAKQISTASLIVTHSLL